MRILLIGGTGFLGTWLTRELKDHEVTVVDPVPFSDRQTKWLMGEGATIRKYRKGYPHVGLQRFDVIIPLVGLLGSVASMENPLGSLRSAEFTLRLLADVVKVGTKPLIVFPSSDLAHRPRCLYSIHKVLVEKYLEQYRRVYGIPYVILRMATGYGPWQRRDSIINLYTRLGLGGRDLPVYGDSYGGDRAFIYAEDAARAFWLAVEGILEPNDWYNLAGHNSTLTEVADAVADLVGGKVKHVPWPPLAKKVDVGHLPIPCYILDATGWRPEIGLSEGIQRTAAWIKEGGV